MSSLAAARADNFYYPPQWDPSQGSLNKFHGQHALRERARKMDQGILILRMRVYDCKGCKVQCREETSWELLFNKDMSFSMKSACCKHEIVIQTDPKNCEYVIIKAACRKIEEFDYEDAETLALPAVDERGKLVDPFYRLELQEEDLKKKKEPEPVLVRLQRVSDAMRADDYAINKALRARLRVGRKELLKKRMPKGKGVLLYDYYQHQTKTVLLLPV